MELWELLARESIRDLVARYNANADSGRYVPVLELFAEDAVFESIHGDERVLYEGRAGVERMFTGVQTSFAANPAAEAMPRYMRHLVSTHQIDFVDEQHATGRAYWNVVLATGLDSWGRYFDEYEQRDGRWLFTRRTVRRDQKIGPPPLTDRSNASPS